MDLHGRVLHVRSTAAQGVVGSGTILALIQKGSRVLGRYRGGSIARGCLVGRVAGRTLTFRYAQRESSGQLHAGRSVCELQALEGGRVRVLEHFRWTTREGAGTNVFDELPRG